MAGCAVLQPAEPEPTSLLLDRMPAAVPRASQRLPAALLVYPPQARQMIDTREMAYSLRPHHLAYYSRNQWAERPSQMLQPLLVRTLEATGRFSAVSTPPPAPAGAYALRTEVVDLLQDYTQEPPALLLVLRLHLSDEKTNRTLAVREIRQREPMQHKSPYGGVVAANAALARALGEAATFVLESTP
jgi:cholesterol transport system auxiliary component